MASCGQLDQTTWYSITPATSDKLYLLVYYRSASVPNVIAVYTGRAHSGLTEIACDADVSPGAYSGYHYVEITPQPGTTYYFQVSSTPVEYGPATLSADVVPQPVASVSNAPSDPSVYDNTQFTDTTLDPFGLGVASEAWTFGDGSVATGPSLAHTYAADGDYMTSLAITTPDGRTASTSQVLSVRTHDVRVQSLSVPQVAFSGQTRTIMAAIGNDRYPEQVEVDLYRRVCKTLYLVGSLVQAVPAGPAATNFSFAYTFTTDDAALGSIDFEAIATIQGYRDAQPADNRFDAGPVSVPH